MQGRGPPIKRLACISRRRSTLASLPESADNLRRRMALSSDLGWTLLAVNSWGNDDTLRAFTEMRELAERLEDPSMTFARWKRS